MIKFEEHDGLLFKMLEEHEIMPLKENDANVLVRFITHGVIGEYVMEHWLDCNQKNVPIYVEGVDSDGDVTVWIDEVHHCCPFPMFEIIGTLVEEGSKEWALYQMMKLGKCVCHVKAPSIKYHRPTHYVKRVVRENCTDDMSDAVWMEGADPTGWQIYKEPKPEPIFATGDKVTDGVIKGTIIHIEDAIASVCPSTDEYKIQLSNLNHIPESPKQDDVEKPLRSMIAEAKAIGKNIRTYYQDIVFTPQALEACLNQGKFRWWNICNWELTTREQNYFPSISTSSDRPKEEPVPLTPDTEQEAIAAWNNRPLESALQARIEELERRIANALDSATAAQNCIKIARVDIYKVLERIKYILTAPQKEG